MYLDLINDQPKCMHKFIWKMKVPLKIKFFMWLLHRKVILTKDNLIKRNWQGNQRCCFCDQHESIQHLFFECQFATNIWRIIHMAFGLAPPKNITNLFGSWLKGIPKSVQRNNLVFIKQKHIFFCRLSLWLPIGSIRGLISNQWTGARSSILGATFWRR